MATPSSSRLTSAGGRRDRVPAEHRALWIALLLSTVVHGAVVWLLMSSGAVPAVDFELVMPADVDFGIGEEIAMAATPPAAAPPEAALAETEHGADDPQGESEPDAGRPEPADRDAGVPPATAIPDAGETATALAAADEDGGQTLGFGDRDGGATLPAGAQIAVRVDMARIRSSPLSSDVEQLLAAIPDWQMILEGSGVDPVRDLDRLLLATPDPMDRSRWLIVGEHVGGFARVEAAVQALAQARNAAAPWHEAHGVLVAPWLNRDRTERIVARLDESRFAIVRPEDLPRLLAVAQASADEQVDGGVLSPAAALMDMGADEALSVEAYGARRYVVGNMRGIPLRARSTVRELPDNRVTLVAEGEYDDAAQAAEAQGYWDRYLEQIAQNPWVGLIGMSSPVRNRQGRVEGAWLHYETVLSHRQIRSILGYGRMFFRQPARRPDGTMPGGPPSPGAGPRSATDRNPGRPAPAADRQGPDPTVPARGPSTSR